MKIALLADIHGNSLALQAVLNAAKRAEVEALCIAGDFVGYYYRPNEVLEMLGDWQTYCVQGNHERMFFDALSNPEVLPNIKQKYGSGLSYATDQPGPLHQWLQSLPVSMQIELDGLKILIAHGAPWDENAYLYPTTKSNELARVDSYGVDLLVLGHTHYKFESHTESTHIVNPGSVGQPRDGRIGAAWALYDTSARTCEFYAEPYNIHAVIDEARRIDPELPYLRDILQRK